MALVGSGEHLLSWRLGFVSQSTRVGWFEGRVLEGGAPSRSLGLKNREE